MKKAVILVSRDGRPSMRTVYRQMEVNTTDLNIVRTPKRKPRYIREYVNNNAEGYNIKPMPNEEISYPNNVVIRWGNRVPISTDGHTITYNNSEAIKLATNKKQSRLLFIEHNVRCPRLVTPADVNNGQYPIIARPLTHSKGRNFIILQDLNAFTRHYNANRNNWYYSEFINKQREFRVHCAHGKVLDVMEKPAAQNIAWNRAQNHEAFVRVKQQDYIHDVCLQALNATKALGLDFAGVDVLLRGTEAFVLEANTSPTLNSSEHVSERYARYFDWLSRSETRREHFNYTEYKKPESFAWKKVQLAE